MHPARNATSLLYAPILAQGQKEAGRIRGKMRDAVNTDRRVPMGARSLYVLIDSLGMMRGVVQEWQSALGAAIHRCARTIKRYIAVLVDLGYIRVIRTQCGNRYVLTWRDSVPENNEPAGNVPRDGKSRPPLLSTSISSGLATAAVSTVVDGDGGDGGFGGVSARDLLFLAAGMP